MSFFSFNSFSSFSFLWIILFTFPFLIINIISNDFPTTNQSNKFSKYINLGDLIAVSGPIDFVLGSVDLFSYLSILIVFIYN